MNYKNIYEKITTTLVTDGYIIIEDALEEEISLELLAFAMSQNNFKQAGISNTNRLHLDLKKRRDSILWLDEDYSIQSTYLSFMNGLKEYLNRELYLGLSYYESHFSIYKEGDFYEKHIDAFKHSKNRVVTTVYYLNKNWTENDGGELIIYDKNDKKISKVIPKMNKLIVFLSDIFPHEVLPSNKKRYAIAGWFRIDK